MTSTPTSPKRLPTVRSLAWVALADVVRHPLESACGLLIGTIGMVLAMSVAYAMDAIVTSWGIRLQTEAVFNIGNKAGLAVVSGLMFSISWFLVGWERAVWGRLTDRGPFRFRDVLFRQLQGAPHTFAVIALPTCLLLPLLVLGGTTGAGAVLTTSLSLLLCVVTLFAATIVVVHGQTWTTGLRLSLKHASNHTGWSTRMALVCSLPNLALLAIDLAGSLSSASPWFTILLTLCLLPVLCIWPAWLAYFLLHAYRAAFGEGRVPRLQVPAAPRRHPSKAGRKASSG